MASRAHNVTCNVVGCPVVTVFNLASANIMTEELRGCCFGVGLGLGP